MQARFLIVVAILIVFILMSCDKPKGEPPPAPVDRGKIEKFLLKTAPKSFDETININIDNKIRILGLNYEPKPLQQGKPYTITLFYEALDRINDDYEFFGHFEPADGARFRAKMDHFVADGKYRTNQWKKGDIIRDVFKGSLPSSFPSTKGVLWAGFFKGDFRMPVVKSDKGRTDDGGRARLATFPVAEPQHLKREMTVFKAKGEIKIDGKLDEPAWQRAAETGPFVNVTGEKKSKPLTNVKLLWNDTHLFIAFECRDDDIWTEFKKRDDPLYRQETIEIMIDADGSESSYYELQVNPLNAVYDAYFPERRRNMDLKWDSKLKSAVSVDGTVNKREDKDKGWTVEMALPIASIKDAAVKPPKAGDFWKVNFYRMEKPKKGGTVASMWSPTLVGDFHTLNRFGAIKFSTFYAEDQPERKKKEPKKNIENIQR